MNLLYGGRYRARFANVQRLLEDNEALSVCELCFGDTLLAEWCKARGIEWTGVDLNEGFCMRARKMGLNAIAGDIFAAQLPRADAFVMTGSLYHFHTQISDVFKLVLSRTNRFVLSEPIRNLSSSGGMIGWLAQRSGNPGDGEARFRFDKSSLLSTLKQEQKKLGFQMKIVSEDRDLLLEISR